METESAYETLKHVTRLPAREDIIKTEVLLS
jgi:hypothetical protein